MKKCVIVAFCALALPMLWLTSCKKNERAPSPAIGVADTLPANPLNPYDSFGYWHNVMLDSLDKHRTRRSVYSFSSTSDYIQKFYQTRGWSLVTPTALDAVPLIINDAADDIYQFIDASKWSDAVKIELKSLMDILQEVGQDACNYADFKAAISSFEYEVLGSVLPPKDQEVLLKCSSIARYSGYRWIQRTGAWDLYQPTMLTTLNQQQGIKIVSALSSDATKKQFSFFGKVGRWIAVSAIDVSGVIVDLSLASGVAASDFMKEVFSL